MMQSDVIVIGGGIGGLSIAAELAKMQTVTLLETEAALGTHATGRSGASFGRSYGNANILKLNELSHPFFSTPPEGFSESPLLSPRPWLIVAREDQQEAAASWRDRQTGLSEIDGREAAALTSNLLLPEYAACAFVDKSCGDIDVHGLMEGYRRLLRSADGTVEVKAGVRQLERRGGLWHAMTDFGTFAAPVVVNAAGAWADDITALIGIEPLGLVPYRRSAALVDPPEGLDIAPLPLILDCEESFYFKPDAGKLMISPADETPSVACDAQPEEIDIAYAVHHYEQATGNPVRTVSHKWAGLRTFAPDRTPVLGPDPRCEGLFWLAGQGGYGLQIAPALAKIGAALIAGESYYPELEEAMAPARLLIPATVENR
ncbi:MAG: NAD(P)/FAD-dependent oxidoreductase [Sphingorhabdus sp.]